MQRLLRSFFCGCRGWLRSRGGRLLLLLLLLQLCCLRLLHTVDVANVDLHRGLVLGLDQTVGRGAADGREQAKDRQRWQGKGTDTELRVHREEALFWRWR